MKVVYQDQPQSMGWCLDCHRNPENKLRPTNQVTNLTYQPSDLDRKQFYSDLAAKGFKIESMAKVIEKNKPEDELPKDLNGLVELAHKKFGDKVTQQEVGPQLKEQW